MPAEGGDPKQLTFHPRGPALSERVGIHNEVLAWFPDGKRIVYLSPRDTINEWFGRPFGVSVDGGLSERLPIDRGGLMSFSSDGTRMAYNRIFRNFRTWKRYRAAWRRTSGLTTSRPTPSNPMSFHDVFKRDGLVFATADAFERALGQIEVLDLFQVRQDSFPNIEGLSASGASRQLLQAFLDGLRKSNRQHGYFAIHV
jgi:hypothetical protein